jgi:hypothetical protein
MSLTAAPVVAARTALAGRFLTPGLGRTDLGRLKTHSDDATGCGTDSVTRGITPLERHLELEDQHAVLVPGGGTHVTERADGGPLPFLLDGRVEHEFSRGFEERSH